MHGRAFFKRQVAQRVTLDPAKLLYRPDVLQFARDQKQAGRRVLLASATDASIAHAVADHLKLFDGVIASDGVHNRRGREKVSAIRQHIRADAFDYIGDSRQDLSVWQAATQTLIVGPSASLLAKATAIRPPARVFAPHPHGGLVGGLRKAVRLKQWLKNLLLFVPLAMAHKLNDPALAWQAFLAFLAFSFCASAVYIFNDLFDLESDRQHPIKCHRPFASGRVSIAHGLVATAILLPAGFALAGLTLPADFVALLLVYLLLTCGYTLVFKRQVLLDAVVLAGLYVLRLLAGGAAVGIEPSYWLLEFSMFLFLSLALAKRYAELMRLKSHDDTNAPGRGYQVVDLDMLGNLGLISGCLWVLVFVLYLNMSQEAAELYTHRQVLWLTSPVFLYWISRLWLLARRGVLHDDPLMFTLTDRISYICGFTVLLLILLAGPQAG
jgi:4-hydroxybenzoate polyprenyltransferase